MTSKYLSKKKKKLIHNRNNQSIKSNKKNQPRYSKNKKKGGYNEPSEVRITESQLESNEIRNLWEDIKLPQVSKLNHIFPYTYPFPMRNINEIEDQDIIGKPWKPNKSMPNLLSESQYFFTNPDFSKSSDNRKEKEIDHTIIIKQFPKNINVAVKDKE